MTEGSLFDVILNEGCRSEGSTRSGFCICRNSATCDRRLDL